jgi:hypothetical protein
MTKAYRSCKNRLAVKNHQTSWGQDWVGKTYSKKKKKKFNKFETKINIEISSWGLLSLCTKPRYILQRNKNVIQIQKICYNVFYW